MAKKDAAKGTGKGSGDPAADAMADMEKHIKRVCLYDADGEPMMPFARCNFCRELIEFWKRMHNAQDEDGEFLRMCWQCVMKEHNLPNEAEARYWIIVNSPTYAKRQKTWDAYKMAKESVQELKGVTSRAEVFTIQMKNMRELFSPMMEQLVRKGRRMELLAEKNEAYLTQMAELKKEANPEKRKQLLEELDKVFQSGASIGVRLKRRGPMAVPACEHLC